MFRRPCNGFVSSPLIRYLSSTSAPAAVNPAAVKKKFPRRTRLDERPGLFRADRVLANRTGRPRKECFELLHKRRVFTDVDTPINGPAARIRMDVDLMIDGMEIVPKPPDTLMVYHKPKWVLSVRSDKLGRATLADICPNMHPVGRLDYDSSGLFLFSSNGGLTQRILHPKHSIKKTYTAVVTGRVDENQLDRDLFHGVETADGTYHGTLEHVSHFDSDEVAPYLQDVLSKLPTEYNQTDLLQRGYMGVFDATELSTVQLTVTEGKYRMVRRILANCGHPVVSLIRTRLGPIQLGELLPGEVRALTLREKEWTEQISRGLKSKRKGRKERQNDDAQGSVRNEYDSGAGVAASTRSVAASDEASA